LRLWAAQVFERLAEVLLVPSHLAVPATENMNPPDSETRCAICGNPQGANETWFSVTENSRLDQVSVWLWTWRLSRDPRNHPVCGRHHAREIILHWVTTGCLHYPFASALHVSRRVAASLARYPQAAANGWLAELSVDRGSVERILAENPYSLNVIFDELAIALGAETGDDEQDAFTESGVLAGRF
jgi:hypothetical protein